MKIPISPRLKAIADEVILTGTVADIGTDHGYLPVYLVKRKGLSRVIATDVNQDPLNKARRVIQLYKLQPHIDLRLGDGLEVLQPGEASTIIIAGMGGVLISELLDKGSATAQKAEKRIRQAVQGRKELRRYLLNKGYEIIKEKLIQEKHRFYVVLSAHFMNKPVQQVDPLTLEIGAFILQQDPAVTQAFLRRKIRITENKRRGMLRSETVEKEKIIETDLLLEKLKEALAWVIK